jgi:hypothetical protein
VRPQILKSAALGAVAGIAFLTASMASEALAVEVGNRPIVNTACSSVPKSARLTAQVMQAPGRSATPTLASSTPSASKSASPTRSVSKSPSPTTSASKSPRPTKSPGPTKSGSSTPTNSPSKKPSPSASSSKPRQSPSPSPSRSSPSPTPTPSGSHTSSPPPVKKKTPQLCVRVQSFSVASQVKAGHPASFAVWVWSTNARAIGVAVHAKVAYALYVGSPRFTVCPVAHGATCNVGNLPTGQADELQLTVKVGRKAALGEQVQLSATASAAKARSFTSSATDVVAVSPPKKPSPSASPSVTITLPPGSLPPIAGTGTSPGNPANLFPTVSAGQISPTAGASSIGLPPVKPHTVIHAAEAAATVPLDSRLIGGQLAGLAVLAGGVAIGIARLSLRTPKPQDDGTAKPSSE